MADPRRILVLLVLALTGLGIGVLYTPEGSTVAPTPASATPAASPSPRSIEPAAPRAPVVPPPGVPRTVAARPLELASLDVLAEGEQLRAWWVDAGGLTVLAGRESGGPRRLLRIPPGGEARLLDAAVAGEDVLHRDGAAVWRAAGTPTTLRVLDAGAQEPRTWVVPVARIEELQHGFPGLATLIVTGKPKGREDRDPTLMVIDQAKGFWGQVAAPSGCDSPRVLGVDERDQALLACPEGLARVPLTGTFGVPRLHRLGAATLVPVTRPATRVRAPSRVLWPWVSARGVEGPALVDLRFRPESQARLERSRGIRWVPGDDAALVARREPPSVPEEDPRRMLEVHARGAPEPGRRFPQGPVTSGPVRWADPGLLLWVEGEWLVGWDVASGRPALRAELPGPLELVGGVLRGPLLPAWRPHEDAARELVWLSLNQGRIDLSPTGRVVPTRPTEVLSAHDGRAAYLWWRGGAPGLGRLELPTNGAVP